MTFGDVVAAHHAQTKPKRTRKLTQSEAELQIACVNWFRLAYGNGGRGLLLHIPNGGSRDKVEAANLKRQGVVPGVPDLLLCLPGGRTCWFELKSATGTVSPNQRAIGKLLTAFGFTHVLIRNLDEFIYHVNYAVNQAN
jgi:hypothetical protein